MVIAALPGLIYTVYIVAEKRPLGSVFMVSRLLETLFEPINSQYLTPKTICMDKLYYSEKYIYDFGLNCFLMNRLDY